MSTFYANKMTIQVNDTVRVIFQDERPGVGYPSKEGDGMIINVIIGEVVLSIPNARALRDLLVQFVKDEPSAETVQ